MSKPNLLAIWAKHERGEGATNGELGHLIERFEFLQDRLEQAEQELVAVKSTQVQHIVKASFETARTAVIALDEAVKLVASWLVDDPDKRARDAEQAVARVRELREGDLCGHCKDTLDGALEGDFDE